MGQSVCVPKQCFSFLPQTISHDTTHSQDTILVVGGGIAGLVAAYSLVQQGKRVILAEKSDRYGGQIDTIEVPGATAGSSLIIEQGAEGFVAKSVHIPRIARELGIEKDLICQAVHESMAFENGTLQTLPSGESARRLGIQVDKKHFGAGLRTFRKGLGQLVMALVVYLERSSLAQIQLNCDIQSIVAKGPTLLVSTDESKIICHGVILACPVAAICRILSGLEIVKNVQEEHRAHSNLNVNLVFPKSELLNLPNATGFSVGDASELRAVSFVHAKFPEQMGGFAVMRAHFRPQHDMDALHYVAEVKKVVAAAIPGFQSEPIQVYVQRWTEALVERTPKFLDVVARTEDMLLQIFDGRIQLAGSSIGHVGIDGAVVSGVDAAGRIPC